MLVLSFILVNNGLKVFHVCKDIFKLDTCMFGPDLVICVIIILATLMFRVFFELNLLSFYCTLLVEFVLQSMRVLIRSIEEIVNGHEYLTEIEIFIGIFFVAALHVRLNFVLLVNSVFDLP